MFPHFLINTSNCKRHRLLFTRYEIGTESLELEPARIDFDQAGGGHMVENLVNDSAGEAFLNAFEYK